MLFTYSSDTVPPPQTPLVCPYTSFLGYGHIGGTSLRSAPQLHIASVLPTNLEHGFSQLA
jgi:hypothetical protein